MNKEQAKYIHISFPFREELCSYTFPFGDEEDEKQLPLVNLGYWQGTVDLETHKLLEWKSNFGECYLQAKVCDTGTYTLLDTGKKPICILKGYVPNGIIPPENGAGDYIHFAINTDGTVEEWQKTHDFTEFNERAIPVTEHSSTPLYSQQHPIMKFNTIGFFTDNQPQMVAFYRNIWGFKTTWNGNEPNVEMTYNGMRLIMYPRKEFEKMVFQRFEYPKGLNGTMELSFDLPTFDDVDNEYARCLQQGVQGVMPPTTEPWGQRTAYIADPDGNLIELSSFTASAKEEPKKKTYTLEEKRQEQKNTYLPWEKEADEYLIRLYDEGKTIKELAEIFERNNGGIRSRLKKLGKIE